MAEILADNSGKNKRAGILQRKKLSTRVDLTPMVDLGFLLITFFIFTATLSESKAMSFKLPADGLPTNVANSTTLTLIPTEQNEILYFHGIFEEAIQYENIGKTGFQPINGIGDLIRQKRDALAGINRLKDFTILIYPDKSASYKNIVDIMDEMVINNVPVYCLSDDPNLIQQVQEKIKN